MTAGIENLRRLKKSLHDASDSFLARVGQRSEVRGTEKDYTEVEDSVHQFDQDMQFFNQAYSNYLRVSNDLIKVISQNQLNMSADVDEVRAQLTKRLSHATKNLAVFDTQIAVCRHLG